LFDGPETMYYGPWTMDHGLKKEAVSIARYGLTSI